MLFNKILAYILYIPLERNIGERYIFNSKLIMLDFFYLYIGRDRFLKIEK